MYDGKTFHTVSNASSGDVSAETRLWQWTSGNGESGNSVVEKVLSA
jgi:hypothetical protein